MRRLWVIVQRSHRYSPVAASAAAKYLRHEPHHHQRRLKPLTHSRETATETQFLMLQHFRDIFTCVPAMLSNAGTISGGCVAVCVACLFAENRQTTDQK